MQIIPLSYTFINNPVFMKKYILKKKTFSYQHGQASPFIVLIVFLLIILASFLVGGIIPSVTNKTLTPLGENEVDFSKIATNPHSNLQLKTFGIKQCSSNAALDLLIDNSGSMSFGSKMDDLKNALRVLASNFPDNGVLTLQTFSEVPIELVPFDKLFGQDKPQFLTAVNLMHPISGTYSKDAFVFAMGKIAEGRRKFPNHKFSLLFISDGIPETGATNQACQGGVNGPNCGTAPSGTCRCFASEQDPTAIAAQIKQTGVKIFTITYTDTSDAKFDTKLKAMMSNVASSPSDAYVAPASNQVATVLKQIQTKICQESSSSSPSEAPLSSTP